MYQFGTGFLFVSASFDDKNHVFAVRLAKPSTSNLNFPSKDGGLLRHMFECKNNFVDEGSDFSMKIDSQSLLKLVSENPVAAVQFFTLLFQVFFYLSISAITDHTDHFFIVLGIFGHSCWHSSTFTVKRGSTKSQESTRSIWQSYRCISCPWDQWKVWFLSSHSADIMIDGNLMLYLFCAGVLYISMLL